jgi:putative ABC transport system permease protein
MKRCRNTPPKIGEKLFRFLLPEPEKQTLLGDYEELYKDMAQRRGRLIANLWYGSQIVLTIPTTFWNSIKWSVIMIRNYLKTAWRNMLRNKMVSCINLLGLTLGMTVSLCLIQLIRYELSYDGFHKDADRIYRIVDRSSSRTQASLSNALVETFPEVEQAGRVTFFDGFMRIEDALVQNQRIYFADPEIMEIFSFPSKSGYDREALSEPFSILITRSTASKYFGTDDPVGRTLSFDDRLDFHVKGVLDDVPENAHFRFDFIAPISTLKSIIGQNFLTGWGSREFYTYFRLAEQANPNALVDKLVVLKEKYGLERPEYHLQPLKKIHVAGNLQADMSVNTDTTYVTILGVISIFILLMACLNYINLSTAQASKRLKEIGLRKVIGSRRGDIIRQFLGEALLTAMLAMGISVSFLYLLMPAMNRFWYRSLSFDIFHDPTVSILLIGIPLTVGCIAGFFPAFYLSALSPVMAVKGKMDTQGKGRIRSGLIVFQFVITVFLLIGSLIVGDQLQYLKKGSSNAYGESIVMVEITDPRIRLNHRPLMNKLQQNPAILEATASFNLPFMITTGSWCSWPGLAEEDRFVIRHSCVEPNFIDFYRIGIVKGRNFSEEFSTDEQNAVLINETAARLMGGEDVVGRTISSSLFQNATVVGILEDFHFKPLHQRIEPLALTLLKNEGRFAGVNYLAIKMNPNQIPEVLSYIEKTWKDFAPEYPLSYDFMDDRIEALYRQEIKVGEGIRMLTMIEIFLSCLGLFGLSLFTAEQRTKEIGVRKVLGASVSGLVLMLFRELIRWIGLASLIAFPIAWLVMHRWLQNFAYHTHIDWIPFAVATLIVLLVSALSVVYHSVHAATANPVEALRYD